MKHAPNLISYNVMEKCKQKKQCSTTRALNCKKTIFLITRFEWISVSKKKKRKKKKYKNNNGEPFGGEQSKLIFIEPNVGLIHLAKSLALSLSDVIATEEIIWTKIGSCMDTL